MQNLANRVHRQLRRSRVTLLSFGMPLLAFSLLRFADSIFRIVLVLLGFSLIIFLHELGHFVVARLCSVKCLAFSLGIGPRAFGWRKGAGLTFGADPWDPDAKKKGKASKVEKAEAATVHSDLPTSADEPAHSAKIGDTDYRLSWLPLGGYVRMLGQDDMDPTKVSTDPRAFNMRPIWQRMCIVSAGVIMNVIFAAVAFSIIFRVGVKFPPAYVGPVVYDSPADKAGLQMGDHVLSIDGRKGRGFFEFTDIIMDCALSSGERELDFEVKRGEQVLHVPIKPAHIPNSPFLAIGVEQMPSLNITASQDNLDDTIEKQGKAEADGGMADPEGAEELKKLHPAEQIIAINGEPVKDYLELYKKVQKNGLAKVTLTIHDPTGKVSDHDIVIKPRLEPHPGVEDLPSIFGLQPRIKVAKVTSKKPAEKAGIKAGDEIEMVGTRTWPTAKEMIEIITHSADKEVGIKVLRDGKELSFNVTPVKVKGTAIIGVILVNAKDDLAVVPAHDAPEQMLAVMGAGLSPLKIAGVDDQKVANWAEIYALLKTKKVGDQVKFDFAPVEAAGTQPASQPATTTASFTVDEAMAKALDRKTRYMLNLPVDTVQKLQQVDNFSDATMLGLEHTKKFIGQVYMTLAGLFQGTVPADNLHGMVGITYVGYHVQERGMAWFWYLMGMVSVNLAVANFLPLPIVDGGLFLLLIVEKIRGKPLSLKVQSAIQVVGIVLLAGLFLFVTWNDLGLFGASKSVAGLMQLVTLLR